MKIDNCPCCSQSMLRHLSSRRSYWLCSHCRLEIPDVNSLADKQKQKQKLDSSSFGKFALKSNRTIISVS